MICGNRVAYFQKLFMFLKWIYSQSEQASRHFGFERSGHKTIRLVPVLILWFKL